MKVKIWGARGSIPTPIDPQEIEDKICQAIYGVPDVIDTSDMDSIRAYVSALAPLQRGSVGGNTACVEIGAAGQTFIIDAGSGLRPLGLQLMKGPCGQGQGTVHLFFSHGHWDHIQGFPFFVPAYISGNNIIIHSVHDLESILIDQQRFQNFPVAFSFMQATIEFRRLEVGRPFTVGPVSINTIRNNHPGDSYGYRFADQHSVFVYASDSEYKTLDNESLKSHLDFFREADALIFDAQYGLKESWESKVDWGHSSAMIGVDLARRAGVKRLLLFHHEPTFIDTRLQEILATAIEFQAQDASLPTCELLIAYEGLTLDLAPIGSIDYQVSSDGEAAILTVGSSFDMNSVDQLTQQIALLSEESGPTGSVLDLGQVELLTTASLKALVNFSLQQDKGPLVLAAPTPSVEQVINLAGYGDYFAIYPTVEDAVTAVQARHALNLPGQLINGQYQIVEKLGQEPLGALLRVRDTQAQPQREAVLRVLSPTLSPETIDHFAMQVQNLFELAHPNIARIYDVDWSQEGDYTFIVEELLVGPTLYQYLEKRTEPMARDEALDLALDLSLAMEYAHSWGVVHGNLRPQDIFLTESGIKVSGFGLGRLEEGRNLLEAPVILSSASYMAPEQILGQPLDARTDIYAMGVMLYKLATGTLPFTGTEQEVMQAHLEGNPISPRELNPEISRAGEHLILKLMAKNPSDRYANVHQARRIYSNLISSAGETGYPGFGKLIGRDKPLQILQNCWVEARSGKGHLVLITGEPGIGKTSLAQELGTRSEAAVVLDGRCHETEDRLYHVFVEALQSYFTSVPPELLDQDNYQLMSNFSRLVPELHRLVPNLPVAPALPPQQDRLRLINSITQFIKRATQIRPWLLILDDLQWVDESSLELLRALIHQLPEMALLTVGIYRDSDVGRTHPLQNVLHEVSRIPTYRHLSLDRLSRDEVGQLLTHQWDPTVPDSLIDKIFQQTEGNPLFMVEVARGMEDDGLVTVQAGRWYYPAAETVHLPQSVYEAVEGRIHYLSAASRDVLAHAAVLGITFRYDDLVALSSYSEWEVLEYLDLALERQLVQEHAKGDVLRFTQAEIHHVIYSDLGTLRRKRLHRRAGETLEERAQPEPERLAEALAHHFSQAGEIEKALVYSIQAGRQAKAIYANESTLQWYEQTLQLLNQLENGQASSFAGLRLSVHQSMGEVLTLDGQYEQALHHFDTARDLLNVKALSPDDADRLAELCYHTAMIYERLGEFESGLEWIQLGLDHLDNNYATAALARLYRAGALLYIRKDRLVEATDWSQKSLAVASQLEERDGQQVFAEAYDQLGQIHWRVGDYDRAKHFLHKSLAIHQDLNDISRQITTYNTLGITYQSQGDWDEATVAFARGLAMAEEIGDSHNQVKIGGNIGIIDMQRGRWSLALNTFEKCLATWRQLGERWAIANTLSNLAYVHICQENWAEARQTLEQSQTIFNEINSREMISEVERYWGELYLKTDEPALAFEHTRRSIELAIELAEPFEEGLSRRLLGQIYQARGETELAEAELIHSLHLLTKLNSQYQMAKSRLVLAQLLSASDQIDAARSYLGQATEVFERLGAGADLAEAEKLTAG